jgi:hypothetical protein
MKSKLFRFLAVCLILVSTLAIFVQSPAFAKEADEGNPDPLDFSIGRPSRIEIIIEAIKPGVANPKGSQPESAERWQIELFNRGFDEASGGGNGSNVNRDNAAGERLEKARKEGKGNA